MASLRVSWPHEKGDDLARQAVEAVARDLQGQLGASYAWEGAALRFRATGAKGSIRIEPGEVVVEVDLGLALLPFRSRIEQEVRIRLATALA